MSFRDLIGRLGDDTAARVAAVWELYDAGKLTVVEAESLVAAIVARANGRATALADLAVSAELTVRTGRAVPATGLLPPSSDRERLRKAARTLLDVLPGTPDPLARAERLGRSEPLWRAQDARGEALAGSRLVEGWVRETHGSKCQLCTWWARRGRVWPKDHPMPRHKGCRCTQTITITEKERTP